MFLSFLQHVFTDFHKAIVGNDEIKKEATPAFKMTHLQFRKPNTS